VWRGLETLELRVARQNATAAALAERLAAHPRVLAVHHPSRPDHPDYALAQRLLAGGGGVLSFEVADAAAAARVCDALTGIVQAPSLGGTQTLVSWPAGVSHVALTAAERALSGLPDGLVRLAVGLEPVEALWGDLAAALEG
jgi:methionine-gamma-lyase